MLGLFQSRSPTTQTTGVKTTNWQWKEVSGSEKKLFSYPLWVPALGSQQKSHYCPCFLQDLHLETSPLLQCDQWLIQVFYQNSEVSSPWKFWWICCCDSKDGYGWPWPNTTPMHCSIPGAFNCDLQLPLLSQTHSFPYQSSAFILDIICLDTKSLSPSV